MMMSGDSLGKLLLSMREATLFNTISLYLLGTLAFILAGYLALYSDAHKVLIGLIVLIGLSIFVGVGYGTTKKIDLYQKGVILSQGKDRLAIPYSDIVCVRYNSVVNRVRGIEVGTSCYLEVVPRAAPSFRFQLNSSRRDSEIIRGAVSFIKRQNSEVQLQPYFDWDHYDPFLHR